MVSAIVMGLAFLPGQALAQSVSVNLPANEVVNRDYLAAGDSVTISGTVNGDVFVAGGTVTIDGVINGDLLAAGGNINLLGRVSEDVRIAGGNILVNGTVGENLTLAGGNLTLSPEARIIGNLVSFGGNLDYKAPVGGDVTAYAGKVLLGSEIGGDVTGAMETLEIQPGAEVGGDLVYSSPNEANIASEAAVLGETRHTRLNREDWAPGRWQEWRRPVGAVFGAITVYMKAVSLLITLFLGWLFFRLFPRQTEAILGETANRFWPSFLVGFASMLLLIPAIVLLAVSLIGIPLILILVPLYGFLAYLAKIFLAEAVGRRLVSDRVKAGGFPWTLLAGLVVYYILRLIPVIGQLTALVFAATGLGAMWLGSRKESSIRNQVSGIKKAEGKRKTRKTSRTSRR